MMKKRATTRTENRQSMTAINRYFPPPKLKPQIIRVPETTTETILKSRSHDSLNRPFPSSLVFQKESKYETFHMKMCSACISF